MTADATPARKVEFFRHSLGEAEIGRAVETLGGIFLSTGPRTRAFEAAFAGYLGQRHALGMTSCTSALFLVMAAWDIGEGDEVIVPAMTFIASPNTVLHRGATPVFVDCERDSGNIDIAAIEAAITPRTKAIMPVHLYGQMADMRAISALAGRHGLKVVEDAAHCVEGARDGYRPGELGDAACFSFYATKNMTSGEGGAVTTNDDALAAALGPLRLHGMGKSAADRYTGPYQHWDMEALGYKANMNDIQAALLLPQLATLGEKRERREAICNQYEAAFAGAGIAFPRVLPGSTSARHLFTIWAPRGKRDRGLAGLQARGIGVAVNFRAVHLLRYYRERFGFRPGMLPVAEEIGDRTITLPLYPKLTDDEVAYVIRSVIEVFEAL